MTDEEKAEEYYEDNECYSYLSEVEDFEEVFGFVKDRVKQAYLDGLAEGRKETEKQWKSCFLTCSSPYCAGHFPAVKMQGELGNMSKSEGGINDS